MAVYRNVLSARGPQELRSVIKNTSWGAIFAGAFVALIIEATCVLLGLAVGVFTPPTALAPLANFGVGQEIWLVITTILAFYGGGWVAGRLCGSNDITVGALHGITTWSLTTVFSLVMSVFSVGMLISGVNWYVAKGLALLVSGVMAPGVIATTTGTVTGAAIAGFISMILNFIAASLGGTAGSRYEVLEAPEEKREVPPEEKREFPRAA